MRTLAKVVAAAAMAVTVWLGQPDLRAADNCGGSFEFCNGGGCDGYSGGYVWECNNTGESDMQSDCTAYCVGLSYPAYDGGILQNYYADPNTGEDSGYCVCTFLQ